MEENILICEDSQEGIFTAIYRAYEKHYQPEKTMIQIGEVSNIRLFAAYEQITSDIVCCEKVIRTLKKRFGEEGYQILCMALASDHEAKATAVYRTIAIGLKLPHPVRVFERYADESVGLVMKLKLSVWHEAHHYFGFLRFEELEKGLLFSEIHPKYNILPYVAEHFADRLPGEHFLIYDGEKHLYAVHEAHKKWFLFMGDEPDREKLRCSCKEKEYQELFQYFCYKIAIEERRNEGLQKNMLPLRFRPYMTEFADK